MASGLSKPSPSIEERGGSEAGRAIQAETQPELPASPVSEAWRDGLAAFAGGRVLYSLVGWLIWLTHIRPPEAEQFYFRVQPVLDGPAGALLGVWQRWDGIHYQTIADQGYNAPYLTAFFPLYPLLGRVAAWLWGGNSLVGLLLLSNLALLLSLVLLRQMVSAWFSTRIARATLSSLVIFPTAFFFYAIYPQSLLLLLGLAAIWQAQQKHWWIAALAALLAGLTHPTAALFGAPLAYLAWDGPWREHWLAWRKQAPGWGEWRAGAMRDLPALLPPIAPLAGLGAFMLWRKLAGFADYTEVQSQGWERSFHWPWQAVLDFATEIFQTPLNLGFLALWINIFVFLLAIGLTVWSFRRVPWVLWWLQAAVLGFLLVNYVNWNPLLSFFRLYLIVFPVYIEIALWGERRPWRLVLFTASLVLALTCSALFFLWQGSVT